MENQQTVQMSEGQINQGSVVVDRPPATSSGNQANGAGFNASEDERETDDSRGLPECAVCLQPCIHPVRLPCSHMFCYLCMKGVAGHSRRCALCRAEIPQDFVRRPVLVSPDKTNSQNSREPDADGEVKYHWYYEGVGGWWEYDERTSSELEIRLQERQSRGDDESATFDILIAGFIYVIDLENSFQYRRGNPRRRRKIKRDLANLPDCKGVAGLKRVKKQTPCERRGGDGGETSGTATVVPGATTSNGVAGTSGTQSNPVASSDSRPTLDRQSESSTSAARDSLHSTTSSRRQAESDRTDAVDEVAGRITNLTVQDGLRRRHRPAPATANTSETSADHSQSLNGAGRESNSET